MSFLLHPFTSSGLDLSTPPHAKAGAPWPAALWLMAGFAALMVWDSSGLDLWLATLSGSPHGFALHDHWFWNGVLHDKIKPFTWALEVALLLGTRWPFGVLKLLPAARRWQLALTTLLAVLMVSIIKLHSTTSCPWDLQQFGGAAVYVSHWVRGVVDGGGGGCFPAGHASAGFAFMGGFLVFSSRAPRVAWCWLAGSVALGLLLGVAQQLRGAHYMSHTLWTAWLCWGCAVAVEMAVFMALRYRRWLAPRSAVSTTPETLAGLA